MLASREGEVGKSAVREVMLASRESEVGKSGE